jgi:hypothetical protein
MQFEPNNAYKDEISKELNMKAKEWQEKKEQEYKDREDFLNKEKEKALQAQKTKIEEELRAKLHGDFENQIKVLSESEKDKDAKLKLAREKELEFLRKENIYKEKEAEREIVFLKKIQASEKEILEKAQKLEAEKSQLQIHEFKKQLDDQKKLNEEMRRKMEQGSMQLQGEVLELALEALLRATYPFDIIDEVAKGTRGADCTQTVRNSHAQACGKIVYESKRTKAFDLKWIEKLKEDMRATGADIAIIVTEIMPKDMEHFGQKDGIWICKFSEVKALSFVLRDGLIQVKNALITQENKGDKMQMLYNFLIGNEFRQNIEAIVSSFLALKDGLTRERMQMEKIWKEREKQVDIMFTNTTQFYGSIKGIAGNAVRDLPLLD